MISVWSCGGGTQSVAIGALIAQGKLPTPDYALIADTGYEKSTTWEYLNLFLRPALSGIVNIETVSAAEYATVGVFGGKEGKTALIPAFSSAGNGVGKMSNFCSYEWKRRTCERYMRSRYEVTQYESWIGFSVDERQRIGKAQPANRSQRYPLIELGLSRGDCIAIVERQGWPPPPRSSCYMCPNQTAHEWREVKAGGDWPKVVEFDRKIRAVDAQAWLTKDCKPIDVVDFTDQNGDLFACESGECFV